MIKQVRGVDGVLALRVRAARSPAILLPVPVRHPIGPDRIPLIATLTDSGRALIALAAEGRVVVLERDRRGRWSEALILREGLPTTGLWAEMNAAGDAIVAWGGRSATTGIESRRRRAQRRWSESAIVTPGRASTTLGSRSIAWAAATC